MSADPGVVIRDAAPADWPAAVALTQRAYEEFAFIMTPAAWDALSKAIEAGLGSKEPREHIVAEKDGVIVGSVLLFPPQVRPYAEVKDRSDMPELRLLVVAPEARGLGIARALVEECIRRARAMGATALGLHTSGSMRVARGLYERLGFERAPEADFSPPGAELVEGYRLRLPPRDEEK